MAGLEINFQNSDDYSDWEVEGSKKRKITAKKCSAKVSSVKKKKSDGMGGKTVEQHRTSLRPPSWWWPR